MDSSTIKKLVEDELARSEPFANFHGITTANLHSFLVEPFSVRTELDDEEGKPRDMWVVLQEASAPAGFAIVYDAATTSWGVVEHTADIGYVLVVSASSLAGALNGM